MLTRSLRIRRLFLHFYDIHFLEGKGVGYNQQVAAGIKTECERATKLAFLVADRVLVPASSFFESSLCNEILFGFRDLFGFGMLSLVGGGEHVGEFVDEKLTQCSPTSLQYKAYRKHRTRVNGELPAYMPRRNSATKDIARGWLDISAEQPARLFEEKGAKVPRDFEKKWGHVPERLGKSAFIESHVTPLLFKKGEPPPTVRSTIRNLINEQYFGSFTREFHAGVVTDLSYLTSSFLIPSYDNDLPYSAIIQSAQRRHLLAKIDAATAPQLLAMRDSAEWNECLEVAIRDYTSHREATTLQNILAHNPRLLEARVGVITALPKEFAAACQVLNCTEPVDVPGRGTGRKYSLGVVTSHTGVKHNVAVCMLTDMGNNSAAVRATQFLNACPNVGHIFMTGIAGGVPCPKKAESHVRLGDIVVSGRGGVVQYDLDKESPEEVEHRNAPRPPSAVITEPIRWLEAGELRGERPWENYIDEAIEQLGVDWKRPPEDHDILDEGVDGTPIPHPPYRGYRAGRPRVISGTIASANKLLKNPVKRDALREKFAVRAVEMEGSGIADATWEMDAGYMVVRGICDYCNPAKGDEWQKYAAIAAAAYTRSIIERLPPL